MFQDSIYDLNPSFTLGVEDVAFAVILTASAVDSNMVHFDAMQNTVDGATDINLYAIGGCFVDVSTDTTGGLSNVYALWTSVRPVPAAIWLFGSALIGFFGINRRKSITA